MMKPELQNWNKSGKPIHQRTLKDLNPIIFHIKIYDKYDTNIGMLEMDDLDLWYYFMILYYDNILWWNLRWNIMMTYYDDILWFEFMWWWMMMKWCGMMMYEMMWFYFVLILWWTVVNDEVMEVDGMNLGEFVSSYMYIYIYNFFNNIHIWKHWNYNQMSHSFHHDDPQRPTERTPLTQMANDFFLT